MIQPGRIRQAGIANCPGLRELVSDVERVAGALKHDRDPVGCDFLNQAAFDDITLSGRAVADQGRTLGYCSEFLDSRHGRMAAGSVG